MTGKVVMDGQRISVTVGLDGQVSARRLEDDAQYQGGGKIRWSGLDRRLVGLFERWLRLRDRSWEEDEIRAFGDLLHRCLFPDDVWAWVEQQLDRDTTTRLSLTFPWEGDYARLAAVPWEFLHAPDRPGRPGTFLAASPGVVLSATSPPRPGRARCGSSPQCACWRLFPSPTTRGWGRLTPSPCLRSFMGWTPTVSGSRSAGIRRSMSSKTALASRPHVVHFMGHGEFDDERAQGAIALRRVGAGTSWVGDKNLADLMRWNRPVPRVVVLRSCDGGRTDFQASFAGITAAHPGRRAVRRGDAVRGDERDGDRLQYGLLRPRRSRPSAGRGGPGVPVADQRTERR